MENWITVWRQDQVWIFLIETEWINVTDTAQLMVFVHMTFEDSSTIKTFSHSTREVRHIQCVQVLCSWYKSSPWQALCVTTPTISSNVICKVKLHCPSAATIQISQSLSVTIVSIHYHALKLLKNWIYLAYEDLILQTDWVKEMFGSIL